jgi:hypothetical protein
MIPAETIPGIGGKDQGEWWRGIVRTFVNATMYLHPTQQVKKVKNKGE